MTSDEISIHELIERRAQGIRERNVEKLAGDIDPNVQAFDVINPMSRTGKEQSVLRTRQWFETFDGAIGVEIRDVRVFAGPVAAFAHYLVRYSGAQSGKPINMWVRVTMGFSRINGQWQVVHDHSSVPFDPNSGKATLTAEL